MPTVLMTGSASSCSPWAARSRSRSSAASSCWRSARPRITGYILGTIFVDKGRRLARVQNDFVSARLARAAHAADLDPAAHRVAARRAGSPTPTRSRLLRCSPARLAGSRRWSASCSSCRGSSRATPLRARAVAVADDRRATRWRRSTRCTLSTRRRPHVQLEPGPRRASAIARRWSSAVGQPAEQRLEIHRARGQAHRGRARSADAAHVEHRGARQRPRASSAASSARSSSSSSAARPRAHERRRPASGLGLAFVRAIVRGAPRQDRLRVDGPARPRFRIRSCRRERAATARVSAAREAAP